MLYGTAEYHYKNIFHYFFTRHSYWFLLFVLLWKRDLCLTYFNGDRNSAALHDFKLWPLLIFLKNERKRSFLKAMFPILTTLVYDMFLSDFECSEKAWRWGKWQHGKKFFIFSKLVMYWKIEKMFNNNLTCMSFKLAYAIVISTYEKNEYLEAITINYWLGK